MATSTDDKYLNFSGLKILWDRIVKKTTIAETKDIDSLFPGK